MIHDPMMPVPALRRTYTCLLALLWLAPVAAGATVTAIKAGKLVDPDAGRTTANQIILVDGTQITAVGAGLTIPTDAKVIDLSHATVLPGLFDAHTHLCMTVQVHGKGLEAFLTDALMYTLTTTTAYRGIHGAANAKAMLEAGFTTIRDVGNAGNYADVDLRRAIENGLVPGPTMINAGRIIAPSGGQFHNLQPERPDLGSPEYLYADTHDELKKAIRENILYGAKVIKLVVDDQLFIYSVDDIKFVVEEAGKAGFKVAAHCMTQPGAHNAAAAGVASIEHGPAMTDEDLKLAKRNNVVLVGTDFSNRVAQAMGVPEFHATYVDRLKRAHTAGVKMAFGTDVIVDVPGETRGSLALSYIESFVEAGLPATEILRAMTTNAAQLLNVDRERGAIRPGMAADIVATPENPLENIHTLQKVTFVMKNGAVIKVP